MIKEYVPSSTGSVLYGSKLSWLDNTPGPSNTAYSSENTNSTYYRTKNNNIEFICIIKFNNVRMHEKDVLETFIACRSKNYPYCFKPIWLSIVSLGSLSRPPSVK